MAKTVSLTLPLTRADLADLEVGDEVLLSGPVYTMRDAGHERALQCLEDTGRLPFDLEGATLFYAGPTPAAPCTRPCWAASCPASPASPSSSC